MMAAPDTASAEELLRRAASLPLGWRPMVTALLRGPGVTAATLLAAADAFAEAAQVLDYPENRWLSRIHAMAAAICRDAGNSGRYPHPPRHPGEPHV